MQEDFSYKDASEMLNRWADPVQAMQVAYARGVANSTPPTCVYLLQLRKLDFDGHTPWEVIGFTCDAKTADHWYQSGHRDEDHDYQKVKCFKPTGDYKNG